MKEIESHIPKNITQKLILLKKLNQVLSAHLPIDYLTHASVVGINENSITLATDSPAWTNKLRYKAAEIATLLSKKTQFPVETVKVITQPTNTPTQNTGNFKKPVLSNKSAELCKALADTVKDSNLKKSLTKLSKRAGINNA